MKVKVVITQLCPTLCDPLDCSPQGSSARGILQARILEWVAIPFSRGFSQPLPHCRLILLSSEPPLFTRGLPQSLVLEEWGRETGV